MHFYLAFFCWNRDFLPRKFLIESHCFRRNFRWTHRIDKYLSICKVFATWYNNADRILTCLNQNCSIKRSNSLEVEQSVFQSLPKNGIFSNNNNEFDIEIGKTIDSFNCKCSTIYY